MRGSNGSESSGRADMRDIEDARIFAAKVDRVFQGRYRVFKSSIGEGGMGTVFRVETNDSFRMKRALKVLYKNEQRPGMDIYAEVRAVKGLDHPCIPRVIEVGEDSEAVYIVQELVEGESFRKIVERNGAIADETIILWMEDVADALSYLHSRGIIHRDIKPTNLMVTHEGRVKLIDFGLAKEAGIEDAADIRVIGTRNYTPPERYEGLPADVRTDIYEYGTTFYNMTTGELPLEMSSDSRKHMVKMRRDLDRVKSPGIRAILKKCIDIDPDRRFQSFDEVRYRLKTIEEYGKQVIENEKKHRATKTAAAVLLALGVILAVAGTFTAINDHNDHYKDLTDESIAMTDEGRYNDAIDKAEEAINFDRRNVLAYQCKYEAMTKVAESKTDGEESYRKLIDDMLDDFAANEDLEKQAEILYLKGNAYYEIQEFPKAEEPLEEAVEKEPGIEKHLVQGMNYFAQGKTSEAQAVVAKLKEEKNGTPAAEYFSGFMAKTEGQHADAISSFSKVIASNAEADLRRKAVTELADMYLNELAQPQKAVKVLKDARDNEEYMRTNWKVTAMLADAYRDSGSWDNAIAMYKAQQKLGDKSSGIYQNIYTCHMKAGQYAEAAAAAQQLIDADTGGYSGYVMRARALCARENAKPDKSRNYRKEYLPAYEQAHEIVLEQGAQGETEPALMEEEHTMLITKGWL